MWRFMRSAKKVSSNLSGSFSFSYMQGELSIFSLLKWCLLSMVIVSFLRRFLTYSTEPFTFTQLVKYVSNVDVTSFFQPKGFIGKINNFLASIPVWLDSWLPNEGIFGFLSDAIALPCKLLFLLIEMLGVIANAIIMFLRLIGWISVGFY